MFLVESSYCTVVTRSKLLNSYKSKYKTKFPFHYFLKSLFNRRPDIVALRA